MSNLRLMQDKKILMWHAKPINNLFSQGASSVPKKMALCAKSGTRAVGCRTLVYSCVPTDD